MQSECPIVDCVASASGLLHRSHRPDRRLLPCYGHAFVAVMRRNLSRWLFFLIQIYLKIQSSVPAVLPQHWQEDRFKSYFVSSVLCWVLVLEVLMWPACNRRLRWRVRCELVKLCKLFLCAIHMFDSTLANRAYLELSQSADSLWSFLLSTQIFLRQTALKNWLVCIGLEHLRQLESWHFSRSYEICFSASWSLSLFWQLTSVLVHLEVRNDPRTLSALKHLSDLSSTRTSNDTCLPMYILSRILCHVSHSDFCSSRLARYQVE